MDHLLTFAKDKDSSCSSTPPAGVPDTGAGSVLLKTDRIRIDE